MPVPSNLAELTTAEKLQTMEFLWQELSRVPEEVPVPQWHREVLSARKAAVESGDEAFEDWETAKRKIEEAIG